MVVSRFVRFEDTNNGLKVCVRWIGLESSENTFDPLV